MMSVVKSVRCGLEINVDLFIYIHKRLKTMVVLITVDISLEHLIIIQKGVGELFF